MTAGGQPRHDDLRRIPGERPDQGLAPALVDAAHLAQVPVVPPRLEERREGQLVKPWSAAAEELLLDAHRVVQARRADQPAHPQRRRQGLAGRAHRDHPVRRQPLDRAHRLSVVAELRVVVVLDDEPVHAVGPLDQLVSALRRQHHPGRRLVCRGHHDDPGGRSRERRHVEAELIDRHGHHPHTAALGDRLVVDRTGVLHGGRRDTLGEQGPEHEVEAVPEPRADEHLVRVGDRSAHPAQVCGEHLAQRGRPRAELVTEVGRGRGPPGHAHGPEPVAHREAAQVGDAVLEVHVEPRWRSARPLGRPDVPAARGDHRPRALRRPEVPLRLELGISVDHDPARDTELRGERPGGGQPLAALEASGADRVTQPLLELVGQRRPGTPVQAEQQLRPVPRPVDGHSDPRPRHGDDGSAERPRLPRNVGLFS